MGKPDFAKQSRRNRSKPAEVKHLSRRRKKITTVIPLVAASEGGGAQTHLCFCINEGCRETASIKLEEVKNMA